ncbi:DUF3068 domain-containing protein [Thermomonospora cellulosilytica]|uniref:DUF3068 domain-containing protein n=1 Tax=Thermomonospora cellulosilytica TaxID=1411118 RepID=A0A7W3R9K2_9ACTN|nr:DUF3068 domain-containing protein [Thermomonospora cellulosilytica]MBA9005458.1 hypothetical protein [Thermomonospora cellulosilytica]
MRNIIGLVLIGLGVFALATGVLVRFYVAPELIAAPTDLYRVTRLQAQNATYLNPATGQMRTGATITATNTIRGDTRAAEGDVAVWDTTTVIEDVANATTIDVRNQRLAFDRRTAELVRCCRAAVQGDTGVAQSGIGLFWPVDVEKKDYRVFDATTRQAWPASFDGEETVQGVRTYRFVQTIPATRLAHAQVPNVPGSLLGLGADSGDVPVDRYHQAEITYWIDPRSGAPVSQRQHVVSTLRAENGPGQVVVADMDLRPTPESQRAMVDTVEDSAGRIRMMQTVIPALLVAGGLALAVAGTVLAGGDGRASRHRRDAREPAKV